MGQVMILPVHALRLFLLDTCASFIHMLSCLPIAILSALVVNSCGEA